MASEKSAAASGGVGLLGWMFLLFLALKLTGVIDWSWWWVTAPLWGGIVLGCALLVVVLVLGKVLGWKR